MNPISNSRKPTLKISLLRQIARIELKLGKKKIRSKLKNDYELWCSLYPEQIGEACNIPINRDNSIQFSIAIIIDGASIDKCYASTQSLLRQSHANWQLILVHRESEQTSLYDTFIEQLKSKANIISIKATDTSSDADLKNLTLEYSTGAWITFIKAGDTLSTYALSQIERAAKTSNVRLIYTDEDSIEDGQPMRPHFKPDWNRSYFYSTNYIGKSCYYHIEHCRKIDGFNSTLLDAHEFDFRLRFLENLESEHILHLPLILLHNAHFSLKVSQNFSNALNNHFRRTNNASASTYEDGAIKLNPNLPTTLPKVTLIIPTKNGYSLLKQCLDSIFCKTSYPNYDIIIVDNGSDESETLEYLEQIQRNRAVTVIRDPRPFNFSQLNNTAVHLTASDLVGLINNDIEVIEPNWLSEMVALAMRPDAGAIGAKLLYSNNRVQHAGIVLGIGGIAGHPNKNIQREDGGYFNTAATLLECSAVTAACLIIRRSTYLEVSGLNEDQLKVAYNDVDFCLKIRERGYTNLFTPHALLYHHESATRGLEITPEKRTRLEQEASYMKATWGKLLENDPNYNPNLTLRYEDYSLSWPPRQRG